VVTAARVSLMPSLVHTVGLAGGACYAAGLALAVKSRWQRVLDLPWQVLHGGPVRNHKAHLHISTLTLLLI